MPFDIAAVAAALLAARRGGPAVPAVAPPPGLAEAYAVQDQVAAALGGVAGWKGGPAAAEAARASPILAGEVRPSPARFDGGGFRIIGIEGEIAFVLARGFAPGATPTEAEVLDAVAAAHVAIEVCDTRIDPWREADPLWKIADCQANRGLVLGDAVAEWRTRELATQRAEARADGAPIGESIGPPANGDPRAVLVAVVRHLCTRRGGVAAGAAITTGSWTGLPLVRPGALVEVRFDGIGGARVSF